LCQSGSLGYPVITRRSLDTFQYWGLISHNSWENIYLNHLWIMICDSGISNFFWTNNTIWFIRHIVLIILIFRHTSWMWMSILKNRLKFSMSQQYLVPLTCLFIEEVIQIINKDRVIVTYWYVRTFQQLIQKSRYYLNNNS